MTEANILSIVKRVVVTFAVAFLGAVLAANAGWGVSVLEKAGVAGLFAAATLLQSILTTWLSGAPQLEGSLSRVKAKRAAKNA